MCACVIQRLSDTLITDSVDEGKRYSAWFWRKVVEIWAEQLIKLHPYPPYSWCSVLIGWNCFWLGPSHCFCLPFTETGLFMNSWGFFQVHTLNGQLSWIRQKVYWTRIAERTFKWHGSGWVEWTSIIYILTRTCHCIAGGWPSPRFSLSPCLACTTPCSPFSLRTRAGRPDSTSSSAWAPSR